MRRLRWVLMLVLGLAGAGAGSPAGPVWAGVDEVYTWTDEHGTVHFSNSGPGVDAQATARTLTAPAAEQVNAGARKFEPVPLDVRNDQKRVRAHLEGRRAALDVQMIVDTGAQKTMIGPELAARLGVTNIGDGVIRGVTGAAVVPVVDLEGLQVGSAELRHVEVMVGTQPGLNLLGMDVLNRLELRVGKDTLDREME